MSGVIVILPRLSENTRDGQTHYDDIKIALGSTEKGEDIAIYKEMARIENLVTCSVCSEEVEHSKPHRDICAVALDKLGLPTQQVVAVGGYGVRRGVGG